jgi:polysaccharide export outer membrane protein
MKLITRQIVFGLATLCAILHAQDRDELTPSRVQKHPYVLGAGDLVIIHAPLAEDISEKPIRISTNGDISLPLVGRIRAAGMTVEELEGELANRLKVYIKKPDVSVSVTEMRSQPVSVIGQVYAPGVHQLEGSKTLVEMLSVAGGLKDDASYSAQITRQVEWGRIPLANAKMDPTGQFSIAEVPLRDIFTAMNPGDNILIMPNDIINVPRAQMVFVIGDVNRPGSIVLGGQKAVTVIQAIAIAAGPGKTAKSTKAKILRLSPGSASRVELPVNLKALLAGKAGDIAMQPEDILFVPTSLPKDIGYRTIEALAGTGATSIIYRVP